MITHLFVLDKIANEITFVGLEGILKKNDFSRIDNPEFYKKDYKNPGGDRIAVHSHEKYILMLYVQTKQEDIASSILTGYDIRPEYSLHENKSPLDIVLITDLAILPDGTVVSYKEVFKKEEGLLGEDLALTRFEYGFLKVLSLNNGHYSSLESISRQLIPYIGYAPSNSTIKSHLNHLKGKLSKVSQNEEIILNRTGHGYYLYNCDAHIMT
jgi:DNA-binding response OmpR family regulator